MSKPDEDKFNPANHPMFDKVMSDAIEIGLQCKGDYIPYRPIIAFMRPGEDDNSFDIIIGSSLGSDLTGPALMLLGRHGVELVVNRRSFVTESRDLDPSGELARAYASKPS